MALYDVIFYLFATIVLVSAGGVVFSRKMMYSAFSLLFTFFGVSGLYVLLSADFIAVTQIMVYVGGILVLIIFGVMLTTKITGVDIKSGTLGAFQMGIAGLASLAIAVFMIIMSMNTQWMIKDPLAETSSTVEAIGGLLFTEYLLAFGVAAILLLVAFIGAALIARRK